MEGRQRTIMEGRLYEASLSGSVPELEALVDEDRLILDEVSLMRFPGETPLHIAALRGHSDFTRALLSRKPGFATELDSFRCSPLHLASAEGHHEIVQQLLEANADVCKVRDEDGRTPLHLAAMKGRVEVVKLLIGARWPESIREKFGRGETVLHLCVKYNRLEALRTLVDELRSSKQIEFVNSQDNDGNTILHLAAALKQADTIEYLLEVESVKQHANIKNTNGSTALDVVDHCPNRDFKSMEIREFLLQAGVRRARDLESLLPPPPAASPIGEEESNTQIPPLNLWKSISRYWSKYFKVTDGWFKEVRGHLITASTLTTTMAYQAGLSPPGSVWQDGPQPQGIINQTKSDSSSSHSHMPGTAILANSPDGNYDTFLLFNTVSLIASLTTLLLALSGFPPENKFLLFLLISTMFFAITTMAFAYLLTVGMISPLQSWDNLGSISSSSFFAWVAICIFVTGLHVSHFIEWLWRKYEEVVQKRWPSRRSNENNVNP